MGARRTLTVLLVGVVVVAASGFATAPGGIGGPTMTMDGVDDAIGDGPFPDSNQVQGVEARLDGPDDTFRAKFRPQSEAAVERVRENVSVRHELGDVLTANVTGAQYRTFDDDQGVNVAPVQRVELSQRGVDVSWDEPTDGETVSGTTDVTIDVDAYYDDAESVTWSVDGGTRHDTGRYPWTTIYGADWDTTDVDDGTHELTAHVEMDSGRTVTESIDVTVDNDDGDPGGGDENESPSVSWSQPTHGASVSGDVPLELSASDPDGSVSEVAWAVDGGDARSASDAGSGTWEATWDAGAVDPGTHELTAIVADDEGGTAQATISVEVADDGGSNEAPTVSWESPGDGESVDGQTTLSIDASDPDGSVQEVRWQVDGGAEQSATYDSGAGAWTATWDASSVDAGTHQLTATAVDDSSATSQAAVSVEVPEDGGGSNEPPSVAWDAPGDGTEVDGTTELAIDASDPDGSVEQVVWRVDGGSEQSATYDDNADAWTATWDAGDAGSGTHQLTATARDDDGDVSTTTVSVDVAGEDAAPTVSWLAPSAGDRVNGETTLSISAADADGGLESVDWRVDDGSLRSASATGSGTWEATWDASTVDTGSHELTAVVVDEQGVQSSATISVEVISDEQPPSVDWAAPTGGETISGTVPIEIEASDPDGSIQRVRWAAEGMPPQTATQDGDTWTAELNATDVLSGEYELMAEAIDDDSLVTNDTISVTVESPNRSPNVSWHEPHDGESLDGTVDLQIEASDPDDSIETVEWGVEGEFGPRTATEDSASDFWEAELDVAEVPDGTYTLTARATDEQGTSETATVDIEVDSSNQAPTVDWETPDDGETVSGEVDLRFEASDPDGNLDQVRWRVNNETPYEPTHDGGGVYTDTVDTTDVSDGEYTLRAGAVDAEGAHAVEKIQIEVDNEQQTEPSVSWNWPEDGAVLAPHEVPIQIGASVEGDEIDRIRWQIDGGSLRTVEYNENSGNYEATWDASRVSSGTHQLRAGVETEAGQMADATIEVTVTQGEGQGGGAATATPSSPVPYGVERIYGGSGGTPSGGEGVDVAVLDSGVDVDHPDIRSSFTRCLDVAETGTCQDQNGHGTHVAGLVAADGSGGLTGVAPGVNLHAYKVLDRQGTGYADDVAVAIDDAAANDVEVVVLSARTTARGSLVEQAIERHSEDLLVVAAAGNQGPETGTIVPPAASQHAVAVGALDQNGQVVDSSSRGITADSFCPCADRMELAAAGQNVESTWHDGGYNTLSGTSVAAPQVAGVAAKAWASGRADADGDGEVTPREVRQGLHQLAVDVENGEHAGSGYDAASGVGMPVIPGS